MDKNKISKVGTWLLVALLGVGLGGVLFFSFQEELATPIARVITVLPPEIREKGQEFLVEVRPPADGALEASGVIQAEQFSIASEFGGRITEIPVTEGGSVAANDLLLRLDTTLLDAQIEAAEALLLTAQAGLAQVEAGVRPGQILVAEAQLVQAELARDLATQVVSDTIALVENPQEVWLQIAVAAAQAEAAGHRVAQAEALRDAAGIASAKLEEMRALEGHHKFEVASGSLDDLPAELPPEIVDGISEVTNGSYSYGDWELHVHDGAYELYAWRDISLPLEFHLMPNRWWQAWVGVNAAVAQQEGIQSSLYHLYLEQEHPQLLEAQVDEALSALAQAGAQVALARAQLDGLGAGATDEQIAALAARLKQAETAVESLQTMRTMMEIDSPLDGTVVSVSAYQGEVVPRGATILTVADLSDLSLRVYVPENQIGRVSLGGRVEIRVDSFPGQLFVGTVSRIADQAEFTPRNVATKEERVNLVFAVEIELVNEDGLLKPGMPADVRFL
jgi:multidrug efflux pump subunit AcrA (membrane-fusion protein)